MAITGGGSLNSVPAAKQQTLVENYLDFNQDMGWAQQYLPDLMEQEAEVFGPRTISGFLSPTLYSKPLNLSLKTLLVCFKNLDLAFFSSFRYS